MKPKPDLIPHLELDFPMMTIMLCPHQVLGVQKPVPDVDEELVAVHELPVHSRQLGEPRLIGEQRWWGPAIHHLEWSGLQGRLEGCILAILGPRQPP